MSAAPSTDGDVTALRRFLGGPDTAWLVQRVRGQIAKGKTGRLSGTVQRRDPTAEERAGALRLVGPPTRTSSTLHVNLGAIEDVLTGGIWQPGLADAVLVLTGPVATWPREQADVDAAWVGAAAALTPALLAVPALETWWRSWCAEGHLERAARSDPAAARRLAADAAACLCALPSTGEPLAVFARRIIGDAHALERDRPLTGLVLAALRALAGSDDDDAPRDVWATAGLVLSTASATVLCLGVAGDSFVRGRGVAAATATAVALTAWRTAGMPVVLTLDQVRSGGVGVVPSDGVVHVCTNPNVVIAVATEVARRARLDALAATDRGVPVLVCTDGPPGAAVLELLERLSGSGAQVRFHGDFDWSGVRIGVALAERVPWTPWRFGTVDYAQAVRQTRDDDDAQAAAGAPSVPPRALRGTPTESAWDPALAAAMRSRGEAIEEEDLVDLLVADLLDRGGDYT